MSFEADMAYLMAELAQAQQLGITTTVVRVRRLPSEWHTQMVFNQTAEGEAS